MCNFLVGDRVYSNRFHCEGIVMSVWPDGKSVSVAHDVPVKKGWWIPGDPKKNTCGFVYDVSSGDLRNLSAKYHHLTDDLADTIL